VRRALAGVLCAAAAQLALSAGTQPFSSSDVHLSNYAFANELGSGIYVIDGRTIQVYQLPIMFELRPPSLEQPPPGLNVLLPITFGFFDFEPRDVLQGQLPNQIGAVSLEPGVELDYWLNDIWHIYPYARAGASFATSAKVNAVIYGFGVRSDYRFYPGEAQGLWRALLNYAGVDYLTSVPSDAFTRLRNGAELRRNIADWSLGERRVQFAPYGIVDVYLKAPSGPYSGISTQTVQLQTGIMFGVNPMWQVFGIELPRIGIGYQFAGALSGWRFVIGDPF